MGAFGKPVPIVLDKPRNLFYCLYSQYWLAERYEDPNEPFAVLGSLEKLAKGGKLTIGRKEYKYLMDALCAGLVHEDDEVTPEKLMKSISMGDFPVIITAVSRAILEQFQRAADDGQEEANPQ